MKLPLVNILTEPYNIYTQKQLTQDEMVSYYKQHRCFETSINDKLKASISNPIEAAFYAIEVGGSDNGFSMLIESNLEQGSAYKSFLQAMPSKTPNVLFDYQKKYPMYDINAVNEEINKIGHTLSEGQYLFHGGLWPDKNSKEITLIRPFSTTFSPQIAMIEAEHKGKAYDADQIDLFVLRATNPKTNVFAFPTKNSTLKREKEVLFASGAKLTLRNCHLADEEYPIGKWGFKDKKIPVYIIEVDIS